jgi:hypothetical protein
MYPGQAREACLGARKEPLTTLPFGEIWHWSHRAAHILGLLGQLCLSENLFFKENGIKTFPIS